MTSTQLTPKSAAYVPGSEQEPPVREALAGYHLSIAEQIAWTTPRRAVAHLWSAMRAGYRPDAYFAKTAIKSIMGLVIEFRTITSQAYREACAQYEVAPAVENETPAPAALESVLTSETPDTVKVEPAANETLERRSADRPWTEPKAKTPAKEPKKATAPRVQARKGKARAKRRAS